MRNDNETDTKKIVRYRAKCWYQATIVHVEDKIEPGFKTETLRVKIVFMVERAHNLSLAHLYIRFHDNWSVEPLFCGLLEQLIPLDGETRVIDQINQLKGQRAKIMFGLPRADGQKQSIIDIKKTADVCLNRQYEPSWKNCALMVDIEQGIIKACKNGRAFAIKRIKELPPSVKKVLFLFMLHWRKGKKLMAKNYIHNASITQTYKSPNEALRKASSRTRCWLNHLDKRRNWGQAIEGTPKNGYVLKIPILEFRP